MECAGIARNLSKPVNTVCFAISAWGQVTKILSLQKILIFSKTILLSGENSYYFRNYFFKHFTEVIQKGYWNLIFYLTSIICIFFELLGNVPVHVYKGAVGKVELEDHLSQLIFYFEVRTDLFISFGLKYILFICTGIFFMTVFRLTFRS